MTSVNIDSINPKLAISEQPRSYAVPIAFVIMVALLLIRPQGLFGTPR